MKYYSSLIKVILSIILLVFTNQSYAQSDFEISQNFKQKRKQLEEAINKAKNLEELNSIVADMRLSNSVLRVAFVSLLLLK